MIIDTLSRRESTASGLTSGSEQSDHVYPLSKLPKKTKSLMPSFGQDQIKNSFNESLPRQFQINSYSQAQNKIDELYGDLQKVVKIARGYREDFISLQTFIKHHFKSADLLFKNSGFLTDSANNQGSEGRMFKVLESCFQETPLVAMAFASPLCVRLIEPMTQ